MGESLFEKVVSATGLPEDLVSKELKTLLEKSGHSSESVSLDELREVLANLLQDVLLETKEEIEGANISENERV
jgi:hypothetical protein